jgi:hypothetical protein
MFNTTNTTDKIDTGLQQLLTAQVAAPMQGVGSGVFHLIVGTAPPPPRPNTLNILSPRIKVKNVKLLTNSPQEILLNTFICLRHIYRLIIEKQQGRLVRFAMYYNNGDVITL